MPAEDPRSQQTEPTPSEPVSSFDHAPLFNAYTQSQVDLTQRLEALLDESEPQPVEVHDPEEQLLLSADEIGRIWGLFPEGARARAIPNPPVLKADSPRWFAPGSSASGVIITDKLEEALSPTSHGLAHVENDVDTQGAITSCKITLHEIPENGFSADVKRLVQAKVLTHELAHTIVNPDVWPPESGRLLQLPNSSSVQSLEAIERFAQAAERYGPISSYSAAYRTPVGAFPWEDVNALRLAVAEELVESITAYLLGWVVSPNQSLSFSPLEGTESPRQQVHDYLDAELVTV